MSKNKLFCGDNLDVLKTIEKESIDLIYIDPPFFSNKNYEVVWGDEAEVRSFEDRWEGGIEHYISWMKPRVQEMYDLLKPTGSFYLHCDHHANAHLRIMMDEIFGYKHYKREIIWSSEDTSGYKSQAKNWVRSHDIILFYTKTNDYTFNKQYVPHKEEYIARFKKIDENGRRYRDDRPNKRRQYLDETEGKLVGDVWNDIMSFQQASTIREYLGYPTQKPEALLERILKASSNEGDIILDAFCGCGTACIVSQKLKRNWIGIDISPTAIKIMQKRFSEINAIQDKDYIVTGMPTTIKELHKLKPFEFQNWIINEMQANHSKRKVGDMGLDGYIEGDIFRDKAGIQVKQSEDIGRNVIDNFKSALERAHYEKGYIIAFSFGKGAREEAARLKNNKEIDIELITVEDLLLKKKIQ